MRTNGSVLRLALALASPTALAALSIPLAGCEPEGKEAQARAASLLPKMLATAKEDVAQLQRGLPAGAKKLGGLVDPDPGANLQALQRHIQEARAFVKDLNVAKATFFSFADPSGTILRSEAETDLLAGKSVLASFPALKKALEPGAGVVEAYGEMQEMRGVRTGPDHQWVLAHPVKNAEGAVSGMFVTGWSYRRYAAFLEDQARRELAAAAQKSGQKTLPLAYAFIVKDGKAYGAPVTPDVNAEAVEKVDVGSKVGAPGSPEFQSVLRISGRTFGIAAAPAPDLGKGAALAIITSDI